jgi:hypothetical protein
MEFISYQAVQGQKYLGIATVNYNGVMLRFKIVSNKDGTGYFPAAASYNVGSEGQDRYIAAFAVDSNTQGEILKELIMERVGQYFANPQQTRAPAPPPQPQVNQNRGQIPYPMSNQPQNQSYQTSPQDEQLPF